MPTEAAGLLEKEMSPESVPAGHLLSHNEKRRALRSYWAWDRIAAYIHYCEDVSRPKIDDLNTMLIDLTRAVLKEISLLEVFPQTSEQQEPDDLPLREMARSKIEAKLLPCAHQVHLYAGHGDGEMCAVCDCPIAPPQVLYEVVTELASFYFHLACHAAWQLECNARDDRTLASGFSLSRG